MSICAVILAAGESKRMRSKRCKFVQKTAGKPIISWVKQALDEIDVTEQVYILGFMQEQVRQVIGEEVAFVLQEKQLGTGHAVLQASPFLEGRNGYTLVLRGDAPLIKSNTLEQVIKFTESNNYGATIISADTKEKTDCGKIVRDSAGDVAKIITGNGNGNGVGKTFEGNMGMYCFNTALLVSALGKINSNGNNKEYCLTDVIEIMLKEKRKIGAFKTNFEETIGVHDKYQLMLVSKIMNRQICKKHMQNGVTIVNPETTFIEACVTIEQDAEILPNSILEGNTIIGEDAKIGPDSRVTDSVIGKDTIIYNSIVSSSKIGEGVHIGPFAYIHQNSDVSSHTRIGNTVEVKNATIGSYSKALNMALITDADIGENVNFGSGSITVNFDGSKKNRAKIGDNSFIGANSNIIAPVQISENAYVAAGSTITDDVPAYGMAIARNRQTIKEDWVLKTKRLRARN